MPQRGLRAGQCTRIQELEKTAGRVRRDLYCLVVIAQGNAAFFSFLA